MTPPVWERTGARSACQRRYPTPENGWPQSRRASVIPRGQDMPLEIGEWNLALVFGIAVLAAVIASAGCVPANFGG